MKMKCRLESIMYCHMQCNKSEIIDTEMETQILSILLELNGIHNRLKKVEIKDSHIGIAASRVKK